MKVFSAQIADHSVLITTKSEQASEWLQRIFGKEPASYDDFGITHDLVIDVRDGYGIPFVNYDVTISYTESSVVYRRSDYQIEASEDYADSSISVFNFLALKHALIALYSAYIVKREWGVVIHSASVVDNGKGYIFAGPSGAGKSTTAKLSAPRTLFSDEGSVIKIGDEGVFIFDSPFRTEIPSGFLREPVRLQAIYLLKQSPKIERHALPPNEALVRVMRRMFYWKHANSEAIAAWRLQKRLVQQVPVYELEFQKNNLFWEVVS